MVKKKEKKAIIKRKKKWFKAVAPAIFKNINLGEIMAFEHKDLAGRNIGVNYMQITSNPRDQNKKVILKINDIKGDTAYTSPTKFFYLDSFIQRATKRYKEKFISVIKKPSKDKKNIKIKTSVLIRNHVTQKVRAAILKKIEDLLTEKIKKIDSENLFIPEFADKTAFEIKKEVKKIYPIDKLTIWKISII